MPDLKIRRPEPVRLGPCTGTWASLIAWFSEFVDSLDEGNLVAAADCQKEIEKFGFTIKYRRLPRQRPAPRAKKGGGA